MYFTPPVSFFIVQVVLVVVQVLPPGNAVTTYPLTPEEVDFFHVAFPCFDVAVLTVTFLGALGKADTAIFTSEMVPSFEFDTTNVARLRRVTHPWVLCQRSKWRGPHSSWC